MLHISAFYSGHSIIPNGNSLGTILIDLLINFTYCRTVSSQPSGNLSRTGFRTTTARAEIHRWLKSLI